MQINQFFLAQLDREVAASRKVLDRVPEGRNSFKPHEKSMELGYLAALVAQMPGWIAMMISTDELNFDKGGASGLQAKAAESREALLQLAEDNYAKAKQALEKAVLLNPNSVKAHYQLGILLGRTGKQDDANKEFGIVHQLNADEEKRSGMRLRILAPH